MRSMRRWMLITFTFTAAAFGLGFSVSAQQPAPIGAPTSVAMPSVTPAAAMTAIDEDVHVAPGTCATCGPQTKIGQKVAAHFNKPRPEPYCYQCSTPACEWRFFLGGCRSFFGEGRFGPALPVIQPHP
jgi:hypothetical protein